MSNRSTPSATPGLAEEPESRSLLSRRKYKAIVIGSGAGGAPAAAVLAKAWSNGVAILEAGPHLHASEFNQIERDMVPLLYAGGGAQATEDGAVNVLQGQLVGGSTVINDALCFRPPEELAERWRPYGVNLTPEQWSPYVERVEMSLGVRQMREDEINRANYLVGLGAARLGWAGERLAHNSPHCIQCGFRHFGCSYDLKQSMNLTFVPEAVMAGAHLHAETAVSHLERAADGWRIHTNVGEFQAEHVVLAAGVVQTPAILLRSGIAAGEGLQFHLQTLAWGDYPDLVDGFNGIPMSYGVLEFADIYGHRGPGYLIEGVANQPMSFSVQPQGEGLFHEEVLRRYRNLAGAVMLLRSSARGRVTLGPGGRAAIHYPFVAADAARIADFFQRGTEMFMAAGASRVLLAHRETRWVTGDPGTLPIGPGRQYLYTAHPFGGANRGTTTDGEGRVKGSKNLWVLDASAFPEAPGVNPQITIAALALQGAERLVAEGK